MKVITIIIISALINLGCRDEVIKPSILCIDCTGSAKLNGVNWEIVPYNSEHTEQPTYLDSSFYVSLKVQSDFDDFFDFLLFFNIPAKKGVYYLYGGNDSFVSRSYFNVFEYEYDVQRDSYLVVTNSNSFIQVDSINWGKNAIDISYQLLLAPYGDTLAVPRNHSYPQVLRITEGKAHFTIAN